jgi:hypothetical protein
MTYNKHAGMGNLNKDEVVEICCSQIDNIFSHIIFNSSRYEMSDYSLLEAEAGSLLNGMYIYMTSVKGGGIMKFGEEILTVTHDANASAGREEKSVVDKINSRLAGGKG